MKKKLNQFKVGDLAFHKSPVMKGKVIADTLANNDYVAVEWQDGNVEKVHRNRLCPPDNALEEDFSLIIKNIHQASVLVNEAHELAGKHGVKINDVCDVQDLIDTVGWNSSKCY